MCIRDRNAITSPEEHRLLQQPSLRMLATSRRIKLAFCPDVSHLRSYLSVYQVEVMPGDDRVLAIFGLIELHRPTSAFSAQGLNRTFSLAVEAALRSVSRLLVSECPDTHTETKSRAAQDGDADEEPVAQVRSAIPNADPWEEEVSILKVTTKSFGAGGRGWVGRTVKLRRIAERWCNFEQPSIQTSSP